VGTAYSAAYTFPVTWEEVEKAFVASAISENPVMAAEAMGLTPMSPVMAEVGTVEIPLLARITKWPAVPRLTGRLAGRFAGSSAVAGVAPAGVPWVPVEPPPPLVAQALRESSRSQAAPSFKADDVLTIFMVGSFNSG
jgi:hypothetical protein